MSDSKPHKGRLELWRKVEWYDGYIFVGVFNGHPRFHGKRGHTSKVVGAVGSEIETMNSRYTLGDPEPESTQ